MPPRLGPCHGSLGFLRSMADQSWALMFQSFTLSHQGLVPSNPTRVKRTYSLISWVHKGMKTYMINTFKFPYVYVPVVIKHPQKSENPVIISIGKSQVDRQKWPRCPVTEVNHSTCRSWSHPAGRGEQI